MIAVAHGDAHAARATTGSEGLPAGAVVIEAVTLRNLTLFVCDEDGITVPVVLPEDTEGFIEVVEAPIPPAGLAPPLTEQQEANLLRLSDHIWAADSSAISAPLILGQTDGDVEPVDADRLERDQALRVLLEIARRIIASPTS